MPGNSTLVLYPCWFTKVNFNFVKIPLCFLINFILLLQYCCKEQLYFGGGGCKNRRYGIKSGAKEKPDSMDGRGAWNYSHDVCARRKLMALSTNLFQVIVLVSAKYWSETVLRLYRRYFLMLHLGDRKRKDDKSTVRKTFFALFPIRENKYQAI